MKRFANFFRNLSVSSKFTITYLAILAIQIMLTAIYLYIQASNASIKQASLLMEQNILQVKESILLKQNLIENAATNLTYDSNVQNFLDGEYKNYSDQLVDYQFEISPIIEHVIKLNSSINSIRLYMSHNIATESTQNFYCINENTNHQLYKDLMLGKKDEDGWIGTHEDTVYNRGNDKEAPAGVLTFSKRIISRNIYQETGLLQINVKESEIFNMLRNTVVTRFGAIYIVDSRNIIISDNWPKMFEKNINSTGFKGSDVNQKLNMVQKINGVNSLVISIPVEQIGCSIVGIFPTSGFNNDVKQGFGKIASVLILSTIFLGIVIYLATYALLGRIKIMVKAMKQVREGNLNVSVEVKSKDEFGELGLSFNHMTSRIHDMVETVYKIELMEKEAELRALEAQINPHFLYNTLATISWSARKLKSYEIEKISNSLAKFYRLVLSKGQKEISAKEEIDMIKAYLYIQKIRFRDLFDVVYDIDEEIYRCRMIKNILQPLVENCLDHGIEPKRSHGTIIIKGKLVQGRLSFKIIDDGVGMSKDTLQEVLSGKAGLTRRGGFAVKNIMERLETYYGSAGSFEIFSKPGIGTVVSIVIDCL